MSNGFDDRRKAAESKWAHDAEIRFKVMARRNKLLGLWAASEMGLSGDAAEAYAKEVIKADFEEVGDEDVYRKVSGDLAAKNISHSEHLIRRKMEDLLDEAAEQVTKEA